MSSLEQVRTVLTSVLCLGERGASLLPETRLLGSLPELDSMAVINLITSLEDQFGIVVRDDEISAEAFETLSNLARFIEQKMLLS